MQKNNHINSTLTDELVIALCGPIGSPLHLVADELKYVLSETFGYVCTIYRLSEFIEQYAASPIPESPRLQRIERMFEEGGKLRSKYGPSILAEFAIGKIAEDRRASGGPNFSGRRCYIIDSIKNQEELDTLRLLYRKMFYFIGVSSPQAERENNLMEEEGISREDFLKLIDRDSGEELDHGQAVGETFPQADFFLRTQSGADSQTRIKLERFLHLVFGTQIITPTTEEKAMFMAAAAAGNSACLSRQVGAALTDADGEILSVGWNDVPKFGGNLYNTSFEDGLTGVDQRCMNWGAGHCSNDLGKNRLAGTIVNELVQQGLIQGDDFQKAQQVVRKSTIRNLMEFSRSVHAEMHAIILGSQKAGARVKGGRLFCTTYPCHSCARHIIMAGITEVYYIEPYRKSLAVDLHADAITELEDDESRVRILLFDGVAPGRYLGLFRMLPDSRKETETGVMLKYDAGKVSPKSHPSLESIPVLENTILQKLQKFQLIEIGLDS